MEFSTLADGAAVIDIPEDGEIRGVSWHIKPAGMDALNDAVEFELSFVATNQRQTNDSRGTISSTKVVLQFLTQGGGINVNDHQWFGGDGIPVAAGERLHIHGLGDAGNSIADGSHCIVYFAFRGGVRRPRRR